ncbi:hypothetical protein [Embleya scabrispora]|uniref:hypothetical protein n=1 Tax=Embleya scabrispora TaxID=159449 RepID=UPI001F316FC7|nr:hypothetical protein [Embleya scabrispora]
MPHEYAEHVLDEVAVLRVRTRYGHVYLEMFRTYPPGATDGCFHSIDPVLPPLGARENRFTPAHEIRLAVLLHAYAEHELDQWTALGTRTTPGPVRIGITNSTPYSGTHADARSLDHSSPHGVPDPEVRENRGQGPVVGGFLASGAPPGPSLPAVTADPAAGARPYRRPCRPRACRTAFPHVHP